MLFNLHNLYAKLIVFLGAVFLITLILVGAGGDKQVHVAIVEDEVVNYVNAFEDISLEAKAAFVWDVNKREALYTFNEDTQLPLASLTKLMTAITADSILPEASVITIDNNSLKKEGDSGLFENERWSFKDLIKFTLMVSSNDGASAIASVAGLLKSDFPIEGQESEKTFVNKMNEKAREVGLTQTYFINPTGLDTNEVIGGAYGSAKDVTKLLEYAVTNNSEIIDATRYSRLNFSSLNNIEHTATNTNSYIDRLPGLIASKTGFTDLAGGNLVVAFDAGMSRPIVISVLGSTQEGRFEDVEKLVKASLSSLD
ncbi:MAG: D-alanyl-D-alanine carboxypeptidase [Parcubacteria group bacterium]|nr:D-alanyl-D-alanine carboxypeptidase [Parcubacteria group bacterium]